MKNSCLIFWVFVIWLAVSADPVVAQFWPGNSSYGYGAWGGYPVGQYNTTREVAAQDRQFAQDRALSQGMAKQSMIQNTLLSQAQSRSSATLSQRQTDRDWWFQTQQQQTAQRQARAFGSPMPVAAGFAGDPGQGGFDLAEAPPEVATDVIPWPSVLQEREFASQRAAVEAPYRRSPPSLSTPTPEDYRKMVTTAGEMKSILEWRLGVKSGLPTKDYEQAKTFLNQLEQEARDRSGSGRS